jgi:hypothetical protein
MSDRPLTRLRATEKALETGQPVPVTKHGGRSAWERLRRKVEEEGVGDVILEAMVIVTFVPVYLLLRWPLRAIGFVLRQINKPVRRFSAAHGLARRTRSFFKRHPRLAVCVQLPIVLAWFAPVVALALKYRQELFPGINGLADIAYDVRGALLLVPLAAAAACLGLLGNGPIAELVTEPEEELDLGSVATVLGMAVGPPIVLALWLSNVL